MLFDQAPKRLDIEPQRSTNLEARKFAEPRLLVNSVHLEAKVLRSLPHVQEPLTDDFIRYQCVVLIVIAIAIEYSTNLRRSSRVTCHLRTVPRRLPQSSPERRVDEADPLVSRRPLRPSHWLLIQR